MRFAVVVAEAIGMAPDEIEKVKYAGLLHDIGKIGVSEAILNKPGSLTVQEFGEIKKHPELGVRIVADVPFLKSLSPYILHHHEFYNGLGYPGGLKGMEIPLGARILGVCDAYEAMTSDRPYRKAMPVEKATSILVENRGKQFDPVVADLFLDLLKKGAITRLAAE
jgi:HD-GYP domain-containing protein (c-di-GMP phosphodiesterase class II)